MNRKLVASICLLLICSCAKIEDSNIPYLKVSLKVDLGYQDKDLIPIPSTKSFITPRLADESTGFGGILVVHGLNSEGGAFYAYDLSCPNEALKNTRIVPDESGLTATCPQCGTTYEISYGLGTPNKGKYILRRYTTHLQGNIIYIRN